MEPAGLKVATATADMGRLAAMVMKKMYAFALRVTICVTGITKKQETRWTAWS